jgi:hypothetical protein
VKAAYTIDSFANAGGTKVVKAKGALGRITDLTGGNAIALVVSTAIGFGDHVVHGDALA